MQQLASKCRASPLRGEASMYKSLVNPPRHVDGLEPSSRFVAAVLAGGVDACHFALDVQRRSPLAPQQPADGLVERPVTKLFRPEIDVAFRFQDARPGPPGYAVGRRTQTDVRLTFTIIALGLRVNYHSVCAYFSGRARHATPRELYSHDRASASDNLS